MKKLIVLATLAALPAVASADVTITGSLGVLLNNTKAGDAGSTNDMARFAGEIRFAGNEDLGNGIKAIWQVANRIDPTGTETGAQAQWGNRDTFVGLSGGFGTVRFGNIANPALNGYAGGGDLTWLQNLGNGISMEGGIARHKHSIRYNSPAVAGFEVAISHQLKEGVAATYSNDLGVKYASDLLSAQLSLTNKKNASYTPAKAAGATTDPVAVKTTNSERTAEFTVSTSFDQLTVAASYAKANKLTNTGVYKKTSGFGFSANYKLGKVTPVIGFWKEKDTTTNNIKANDSFTAFTAGFDYSLSKRTNAGFEIQNQTETVTGKNDGRRVAGVYLFHKF